MANAGAKREPSCGARGPWYVPIALRRSRLHLALAGACALAVGACGGGERQDENEPEGNFKVEIVKAEFPSKQKLAKRSNLVISVKNAEANRSIPNIAVTVRGFDVQLDNKDLADPKRPVFVINGVPKDIGTFPESKDAAPEGGETAYVDTWALGPLKAGEEKSFRWNVTAVRPGPYRLRYRVAAGLDGKAKAVGVDGRAPAGLFLGTVDDKAPDTRIADDGVTVIEGPGGKTVIKGPDGKTVIEGTP